MSGIRRKLVNAAFERIDALEGHSDIHKHFEFRKQAFLADESLNEDEKSEAMKILNNDYDYQKVVNNDGTKRTCENCREECLATLYCEYCIRNYLKTKFSSWTSGNDNIDNLIQECQLESLAPDMIVEWIPYNSLQNIKYLTKGGCSEIYSANWINGSYKEWNIKEKKLIRFDTHKVVLKRLVNIENANRSWFEEAKSHLIISNKWIEIVPCFGLTQDLNGDFMLVLNQLDIDLKKYLQQNHNQITWKEKIQIISEIIEALYRIHSEKNLHRDLHSGNILYLQSVDEWYISDLGFCGPADKPLKSIYGNLPYIAPEVITGKEYTFASDIYSIAMLMWEISSEQPPFINYEHNYDLAMNIINGMRPEDISGTPLEYKELMEQCWNADPTKRLDINILKIKINEMSKLYYYKYQSNDNTNINQLNFTNFNTSSSSINSLIRNFNSKIYNFKDLPEPKNTIKDEQKVYHSIQHDLSIPNNISKNQTDFMMLIDNEEKNKSKRIYSNASDDKKENLSNQSKRIKLNNKEIQYLQNTIEFQNMQRNFITNDDYDEICNNPNLHSEDQNELEIPEDI